MNNLPAGADNDPNAPYNKTDNYCLVCDKPLNTNKAYCSERCRKADFND